MVVLTSVRSKAFAFDIRMMTWVFMRGKVIGGSSLADYV